MVHVVAAGAVTALAATLMAVLGLRVVFGKVATMVAFSLEVLIPPVLAALAVAVTLTYNALSAAKTPPMFSHKGI
jgi:hypothetical protein